MIRVLAIVAVIGFLMSVVCISAAVAIGGPEAVARGAWSWDWSEDGWGPRHGAHIAAGPTATRELPWAGGSTLEVDAPADIEYVQAPGPATITVSGSPRTLDALKIDGSRITAGENLHHWGRLHITLRAPAVSRFDLRGTNSLSLADYKQDELSISIAGHGDVSGRGETKSLTLRIAGSGDADLGAVKTPRADVEIRGAGDARIAPTEWARVDIAGAGDVELLTRPPHLESHIAGAGRIRQPDRPGGANADRDEDESTRPA